MIKLFRCLFVLAGTGWAGAANAQAITPIAILELFTSQGCSSCPAADALFKSYVEDPDVVALSYSVDYWDYLGWKDTLASPKFTDRQRAYGKIVSNGQVYTPQMVINGASHAVGSSRRDIEAGVAKPLATAGRPQRLEAKAAEGAITLRLGGGGSAAPKPGPGVIWLVTVKGQQTVKVLRGENSGRSLTYFNIVKDVVQIGSFAGTSFGAGAGDGRVTVQLPARAALGVDERYAVLLQRDSHGALLAAGWVK
jgi:hypothetical protein